MRALLAIVIGLLVALSLASEAEAAPCWRPPVTGSVADPFREPPCPWCAGNRGIEFRVGAHTPVRAVAAGVVTYSGAIAGVGYLVVRHADGRRVTYGHLDERFVVRGHRVSPRQRIGVASGTFHLGLRVGDRYVDPAPHLGRLVGRPRLVPLDGTIARPAPSPTIRCGTSPPRR